MAIPPHFRAKFEPCLSVRDHPSAVNITEKDPGGAGIFAFQIDAPAANLTVQGEKIFFCTNAQCADGGIIVECPDGIHLHLIELKSKVSTQKWDTAKKQLEGMFQNLLAISAIAQLGSPIAVTCHVAFSEDAIAALPVLSKTPVGATTAVNASALEWMSGSVTLAGIPGIKLRKYKRDAAGNAEGHIAC